MKKNKLKLNVWKTRASCMNWNAEITFGREIVVFVEGADSRDAAIDDARDRLLEVFDEDEERPALYDGSNLVLEGRE